MQGPILPDWTSAVCALAVLFIAAYLYLRRAGLAVLIAAPPFAGFAGFLFFAHSAQPAALLAGYVLANFWSAVLFAQTEEPPARNVAGPVVWAFALAVFTPLSLLARDPNDGRPTWAAMAIAVCGLAALMFTVLAVQLLRPSENAIARMNRLREARERWLDRLAFLVQPRWGLSIGGIALILAILGYFGGANAGGLWPLSGSRTVLPIIGVIFLVIGSAAIRDWRRVLAFLLSDALLMLLAYWLCVRMGHVGPLLLMTGFGLAAMPILIAAAQSAAFARTGDAMPVASLRAFEQNAAAILFVTPALGLVFAIFGEFASAVLAVLGGVIALIILPALVTALYSLFPARASLDAYRLR